MEPDEVLRASCSSPLVTASSYSSMDFSVLLTTRASKTCRMVYITCSLVTAGSYASPLTMLKFDCSGSMAMSTSSIICNTDLRDAAAAASAAAAAAAASVPSIVAAIRCGVAVVTRSSSLKYSSLASASDFIA